jgi:cardiolipin synthase (CMP-forming)
MNKPPVHADCEVLAYLAPGMVRQQVWTTANLLTVSRIVLIMPFLYCIQDGRFGLAMVIFFVASVTDYLDGYIARRFHQQSALGRFLDPMADKLLTTASFVVLALPREGFPSIPVWLAVAVVGRDVVILAGSAAIYAATRFRQFKPTLMGRINTTIELTMIVWFLGFHTLGILIGLLPACYVIVFVSVVLSGAGYVAEGVKIVRNHRRAKQTALPISSSGAK